MDADFTKHYYPEAFGRDTIPRAEGRDHTDKSTYATYEGAGSET